MAAGRRRQHGRAAAVRGADRTASSSARRPTARRAARSSTARREPVQAKGKAEPVPVWEAVAAAVALRRRRRAAAAAPLVGRATRARPARRRARARPRANARRSSSRSSASPGSARAGSSTSSSTRRRRDPELICWRQGRSLPYGEGVTFWALGEMVKAQAGILETDARRGSRGKLRGRGRGALIADEVDARLGRRAHLRPLVGLAGDAEVGGDRRARAFAAWRRFFEALAERAPARARLRGPALGGRRPARLRRPPRRLGQRRAAARRRAPRGPSCSSGGPAGAAASANATTISLAPLSETETARARRDAARAAGAPGGAQAALLARAGGNPLYAEEYVRMRRRSAGASRRAARRPSRASSRRASTRSPRDEKDAAAGRGRPRQGLLGRRARGDRRARAAATVDERCTRSSGRSSCGASAARRSPARPSTRSATCSSATSPTGRSRARARADKHRAAADGSSRSAAPRTRRAARAPLPGGARVREGCRTGRRRSRGARAPGTPRRGRSGTGSRRTELGGSVLRGRARALAGGRSRPRGARRSALSGPAGR